MCFSQLDSFDQKNGAQNAEVNHPTAPVNGFGKIPLQQTNQHTNSTPDNISNLARLF